MSEMREIHTIQLRAGSATVASGNISGETGPLGGAKVALDERIDINNDGKVDYVVHHDSRTISFSREFRTTQPAMCGILAKSYKMKSEGVFHASDQRQFDSHKKFAVGLLDQLKSALSKRQVRREGDHLIFRGKDGFDRTLTVATTNGQISALTILGLDGERIHVEDPALIDGLRDGLAGVNGSRVAMGGPTKAVSSR